MAVFDFLRSVAPISTESEFRVAWRSQQAEAVGWTSLSSKRMILWRKSFSLKPSSWNIQLDYRLPKILRRQCTSVHSTDSFSEIQRARRRLERVLAFNNLDNKSEEEAGTYGESSEEIPGDDDSGKEIKINLQLPRRRLLVEFTCDICKARTQRLINPEAYSSGTVYVQCEGCETYHKLVDNLGLVVEYDFRDEDCESHMSCFLTGALLNRRIFISFLISGATNARFKNLYNAWNQDQSSEALC